MITIVPKLIWHQGAKNNNFWSFMFENKINTLQLAMILNNKINVLEKNIHILTWLIDIFQFFWQFQKVIN
jgi:hypothetical protein